MHVINCLENALSIFLKRRAIKQFTKEGAGYLPSARSGRDPQGDGWSEDGGKVFRDAPKTDMDIQFLFSYMLCT